MASRQLPDTKQEATNPDHTAIMAGVFRSTSDAGKGALDSQ